MGEYRPKHIDRYLKEEARLADVVKTEFSSAFIAHNLQFEGFYKKLRKIDKAVFLKVGHFLHYYAKRTNGEHDHANAQLRFLACISVIESCFGENKQEAIITFLKKNVSKENKENLFKKFSGFDKRNKKIINENIFWQRLIDIRNNFMHRSILITFADDVEHAIVSNYGKKGRYTGSSMFSLSTDCLVDIIKEAIINYFKLPIEARAPKQNYKVNKIRKK